MPEPIQFPPERTQERVQPPDPLMLVALALRTLSRRVFLWTTLGLAFTLFAYAVVKPEPLRILAAALFTVLVYLPTWLRKETPHA